MDQVAGTALDQTLRVTERLQQLRIWREEWRTEDTLLDHRANQLDPNKYLDTLKASQISNYRQRIRLKLVRKPLVIAPELIKDLGYPALRQYFVEQFARLSKEERLLWLNNFLFILTPDLRRLNDKIENIRGYRALGQQRNFLLGGPSGMGKTTYLDWFSSNYLPQVEQDRNYVPIVKIDAPVSNHTPKPLLQRIILECGMVYLKGDNEEDLLRKLALFFQKCGVEVLIIDEVEQIVRPELRRRVLEVSNLTRGVPIICASCEPLRWIEGDTEVAGRWNDYFELHQYTGERLQQLLAMVELLLPFTQSSYLPHYEVNSEASGGEKVAGPARFIEQWTGGILRDIMILIADASARAIRQDLTSLSLALLEETWKDIQTHQVTDFLAALERRRAAAS